MTHPSRLATLLIYASCLLFSSIIQAETLRIAVAANFAETLRSIAKQFEENSEHKLVLVVGSTGKHYAQIRNGAPFDAFFAADRRRPEMLDQQGLMVPDSRFTYAVGRLALWSPDATQVDPAGEVLKKGSFRHLAIANPKLAPYGRAAQQLLQKHGLWQALQSRMVRGENIGQAFQFVKSGSAELGLVALSQIQRPGQPIPGSYWLVPGSLHTPIEQQAVLLRETAASRAFYNFFQSDRAKATIQGYGYGTPDAG
ncbi:molybdate ABC transporter substrate-binding protein [Candidatus Endoriftia persephonae]|jgi:molybdate transport system substrate-binding protein|uniref:Molybdate-binding periplasmic protein n=2 Tax=Gammaproteobacteria TaxID=1236 RepID=G2FEM3_9GAMM|nr:molybdate ABC transporter substrate-binding protein [Candidatus Endoriftia persephone]EGW54792.1 molybdate-binding periplasmic protein [endosymbiont of Tevnia jerichonana (vent Tica)]USF87307.1 molybdate ABC transporter substrate-binding protein [Candidatus Endoriftia persephone]